MAPPGDPGSPAVELDKPMQEVRAAMSMLGNNVWSGDDEECWDLAWEGIIRVRSAVEHMENVANKNMERVTS